MFHALPEPPALSLAAARQKSWVLCMGASQGAPCPGPSPSASSLNFLQPISLGNQRESRREMVEQPAWHRSCISLAQPQDAPYCKDVCLCWDTQPAPKARTEGWSYKQTHACRAPALPPFLPTLLASFELWLGFKVATGAEESPRAQPWLARDAIGAHAPAARTSRRRVWSQAAAAPSHLPRDLA